MGIGNLTELTDCDSAAVNVLLLGVLPGVENPQRSNDASHRLGPGEERHEVRSGSTSCEIRC